MTNAELIRDFVNTRDVDESRESLGTAGELAAWLAGRGLIPAGARATARDLDDARELREALRTLLLVNNEVELDPQPALSVVDNVAERARVELRFQDGGAVLVPRAAGATGGLGRILTAVHASMADDSWSRLKACRADDCLWAFVDHAKNRSRAWCSMRVCGNREKARAFRVRQRA